MGNQSSSQPPQNPSFSPPTPSQTQATEEEQQERKEQSEIEGREESKLTESNLDNIPESDKVFDGVEFPENIDEGKNSTPIRMKVDEEDNPIIKTQEIPNRFPGLEQGKAFPARSTDVYSREPGKVNHQAELLGGENPKGKDLVHQEEIDENTSDESAFEYSNTRNTNTLITDSQASVTTFSVPELIPDHFSDQNSQLSPQHPLPAPT
ncbi:unnamed protein product [Moneuplotes crassus]|uniref:Uncharacterized protein n=1 Tax=Euplotes crassus TaxID=5936 RepID=A0AAD1X818_EUPCR|nr:unnamed protein product [Moneuplotes crassus]